MAIESLRELLLKKAEDNPYLRTLIEYAREDILIDNVMESLKKMAEPSAAMGRFANSAITSYAGQMDNSDVEQMRDALAHHISHYKSALKHGNKAVANEHLDKIVPLMHLAARVGKHSGGKAVLDYRSMIPWETNYTTPTRISAKEAEKSGTAGKLKEGTKDLGRRPNKGASHPSGGPSSRTLEHRNVPDYRYLEMPPHPEHADTKNIPNKGGYPFEEIQFGSPQKRDLGQAYLPIEDVGKKDKFTEHPFDKHPIHEFGHPKMTEANLNDKARNKFAKDLAAWKSSDEHKGWLASQKEKHAKDPEAYGNRGKVKPEHHFTGIPLLEPPIHHKQAAAAMPSAPAPAEASPAAPVAAAPIAAAQPKLQGDAMQAALQAHFAKYPKKPEGAK
jgi:hypothetical protein